MLAPRRPALFTLLGVSLLLGVVPSAAWAGQTVTAEIDVAVTPEGPQLIVRIDGGNGILVRGHGDSDLEITETGNWGVRIESGAASRCRPAPDAAEYKVHCSRAGLLSATPSRKPLRFEMGPTGGRAHAPDAPLAIEASGGPATDAVTGSPFADLIRLGSGNDEANGWEGDDLIELGPGIDQARGSAGDDRIDGGDGPDWIQGDSGRDLLVGGGDDDLLMAEPNSGDTWGLPDVNYDADGSLRETVDEPADCGAGDDTVVQRSAALDPVLGNCEHTLLQPAGAPLTIQGTLTVGSMLTAVRPPVGVEASFRADLWLSCDTVSEAVGSGCVARSNCPTFRLEQQDAGRQVMVINRTTYSLAGGRYKVQPGDERVWTALGVGRSTASLGPRDLKSLFSGNYAWLYVDGVGQQDRTGGSLGEPASDQRCGQPTPTPVPAPTPVETPIPTPTATVSPTPTPAARPAATAAPIAPAGPVPTPAASPATTTRRLTAEATVAPLLLAKQLRRALQNTSTRALIRHRSLAVTASAAAGTVIRVQVRDGSRWLNVGVGRISANRVTVRFGPVGRARLQTATHRHAKTRLRVLVRGPGSPETALTAAVRR